jgi:uncharacterized coiled-coil protein SlyX
MDGTRQDVEGRDEGIRAIREENSGLRQRIAELERTGLFQARSIDKLIDQVVRLTEEIRKVHELTSVAPRMIEAEPGLPHPAVLAPVKQVILYPGRKIVHFARRHRSVFAPHGSRREWLARRIMAAQRQLRGIILEE